jgi:flagellar assembly protein FliH
MMTAPVKFLFEDDFALADARHVEPTITLAAHTTALAAAEEAAYRNGVAAADARAERRLAAACERIAAMLEELSRGLGLVEARLEAEAVEVAAAVAAKLAPELIAREPFAEIAGLTRDCFRHLIAAPHVVVRVADALYEAARTRLDEIARGHGFDGRLVVLAEQDLSPGDCRIEWADGGMVRDRAATEAAIAQAVGRYVASRRADGEPGGASDE